MLPFPIIPTFFCLFTFKLNICGACKVISLELIFEVTSYEKKRRVYLGYKMKEGVLNYDLMGKIMRNLLIST